MEFLPPGSLDSLQPLLTDTATYAQRDADPLAQVQAGTVVDPLEELDGCWGAFFEVCGPQPGRCLSGYQLLAFDARSGTLTRYTLQNLLGLEVLDAWEGTYDRTAAGELTFSVRRVESNLPGVTRLSDITDRYRELPQYDVRVTLDGDELKAVFVTPADNPRTPAGFLENIELIHRRLDCVE